MARQQLSPLSRSIFAATSAAARRMVSVIDMTLLGRGVGLGLARELACYVYGKRDLTRVRCSATSTSKPRSSRSMW